MPRPRSTPPFRCGETGDVQLLLRGRGHHRAQIVRANDRRFPRDSARHSQVRPEGWARSRWGAMVSFPERQRPHRRCLTFRQARGGSTRFALLGRGAPRGRLRRLRWEEGRLRPRSQLRACFALPVALALVNVCRVSGEGLVTRGLRRCSLGVHDGLAGHWWEEGRLRSRRQLRVRLVVPVALALVNVCRVSGEGLVTRGLRRCSLGVADSLAEHHAPVNEALQARPARGVFARRHGDVEVPTQPSARAFVDGLAQQVINVPVLVDQGLPVAAQVLVDGAHSCVRLPHASTG